MIDFDQQDQANHPRLETPAFQMLIEAGLNRRQMMGDVNSPYGLAFDRDGRMWIQTDGDDSNAKAFEGMGNNQMLCANALGIQHPGEKLAPSHFPEGGDAVPRSSVVTITRRDGGVIGT